MPAADTLPPIGIEDYGAWQSDQFGQTTDAMLATLDKPPAPPIVADQADRATPPTPPAPDLPDAASISSPIDASASSPAAPAAPAMAPAQPAPPPAPVTPAAPPATDDLSPALNAASAAGVDPGVFIAAHQSGHVDPNNWFDSATQLAGHIKDAGGDLVQGLAAFTGSATNAAKVLDRAVANLNPAPVATTPDNSAQGATQTTAELSGGGKAVPLGDAAHAVMSAAANSAAWLGEQGQKALQAILVTEGGMTGARGDQGNSAGPLQFYSGGQLANFAQQHGMTQDAAKTYVEAHPQEAVAWAIGSPDHPGYLGSALAAGLQKGLSGPALATYGQQHGQVSVSPERAGQNWNALFGNGSGPFTATASTNLSTNPSTANSVSQFGDPQLTTDEAYAACGPAAAVRFAQAEGRNPTLREATDLAKSVGWTSASGMAGLQSEKALMDKLQIPTRVVSGAAWDAFSREAQTGNPVTISTAGHYFYADGFNPDTGAFHVGQSGLDLKGGSEWMTPAQMTAKMGPVQGGLLADNPTITNPSTVMGANQPADRQDRADASASNQPAPAPSSTGNSALDWLGQQKDALASTIGNAASGVGTAVSGAVDAAGNALPDTSAILGSPQQSALATRLEDPNTAAQNPIGTARDINAGFTQAQNEMTTAINPARDVPVLGGLINQATNPENYLLGAAGGVAGQAAMGAGLAAAQAPLGSSPEDIARSAALGGALGGAVSIAPAVAKGVAAGAPKVLDTGLEALDRLRPPDVAFASTMSGPQQALNDARQAVADLAARFPKMSPGSLAASGPGKQLAALEADAAANPEKYVPRVEPATPAVSSPASGLSAEQEARYRELFGDEPAPAVTTPAKVPAANAPLKIQVAQTAPETPRQTYGPGNGVLAEGANGATQTATLEPGWTTIPGKQGGAVPPKRPSLIASSKGPAGEAPVAPDATEPFGHTAASRAGITPETVQIAHQRIDTALQSDPTRADMAHNELDQMLSIPAAPDEVTRFLSGDVEGHTVSPTSVLRSVRTGSMAGGLTTMGKVALGPVVQVAMRAPVAAVKAVVAGRAGDIPAGLQGGLAGLAEGSQDALQTLRYGTSYRAALTGGAKGGYGFAPGLDVMGNNAAQRAAGTAAIGLVRAHGAVSDISSSIGRRAALATGATPEAAAETGQQWALRSGNYGTVGQAVSDALEGLKRTNPALNVVGQILVPFYRVGYNAFTQGVERSPVGLVGTGIDVARGALGKGPYAAGADASHVTPVGDRLANNLFGVGLAGVGLAEAAQGNITGENPQNGAPKWSVRAAGQWVPLRTLGPAGEALAQSAILYESARDGKGNIPKAAETAAAAYVGHVNDETWLRSLGDTFSTIGAIKNLASAKRSTTTSASKELAYQAGNIGKSFIPQQALGSQIVKAITGAPASSSTAPVRTAIPAIGRYAPRTNP